MELNYDEDDVKPSTNVKEASYFNIFECGRNVLDKLDVTYQRAFTASKKTSREVRVATRVKNIGKCRREFLQKEWPERTKDWLLNH